MSSVTLLYGPYEANGIIKHRPQRLHSLLGCLTEKDYEVEIIESKHINRLTVEMKERVIFQCDIRHLLFNMPCDTDVVCRRIIDAIEEAETRCYADRNIPMFASVKEGMRYLQTLETATTKDCFNFDVGLWYEIGNVTRLKDLDRSEMGEEKQSVDKLTYDEIEELMFRCPKADDIMDHEAEHQKKPLRQKVEDMKLRQYLKMIGEDFLPEDAEPYGCMNQPKFMDTFEERNQYTRPGELPCVESISRTTDTNETDDFGIIEDLKSISRTGTNETDDFGTIEDLQTDEIVHNTSHVTEYNVHTTSEIIGETYMHVLGHSRDDFIERTTESTQEFLGTSSSLTTDAVLEIPKDTPDKTDDLAPIPFEDNEIVEIENTHEKEKPEMTEIDTKENNNN